MQIYRLEILDDKVITVLQGLVELSHIKLAPIYSDQPEPEDDKLRNPISEELKHKHPILKLYGAWDRGKTIEEIDAEIEEAREGWL